MDQRWPYHMEYGGIRNRFRGGELAFDGAINWKDPDTSSQTSTPLLQTRRREQQCSIEKICLETTVSHGWLWIGEIRCQGWRVSNCHCWQIGWQSLHRRGLSNGCYHCKDKCWAEVGRSFPGLMWMGGVDLTFRTAVSQNAPIPWISKFTYEARDSTPKGKNCYDNQRAMPALEPILWHDIFQHDSFSLSKVSVNEFVRKTNKCD